VDFSAVPSAALPFSGVPYAVRLPVDVTNPSSVSAFDAHAAMLRDPAARLWVVLRIPVDGAAIEPWRTALRALFKAHQARIAICELSTANEPPDVTVLAVRTAATELRAAIAGAQLALALPASGPGRLTTFFDRDLAAYVDLIAAPAEDAARQALASLDSVAPSLRAAITGLVLPADADGAANAFARAVVDSYGTRVAVVAAHTDNAAAIDGAARALRWLEPLLAGSVELIDAGSSGLSLRTKDGAEPSLTAPPRLFFDNDSLSTLLFYDAPAGPDPLAIRVTVPVEGTPKTEDLKSARWKPAARRAGARRFQRGRLAGRVRDTNRRHRPEAAHGGRNHREPAPRAGERRRGRRPLLGERPDVAAFQADRDGPRLRRAHGESSVCRA
jgi:hypothetical protein